MDLPKARRNDGYKCNLFVADVLAEAGIPVDKLHDSWTSEY